MAEAGRVVVITGGSKGIGRAVAMRFAREKARIVLVHYDPDEKAAEETLDALVRQDIEAECHKVDVSSFEAVDVLFKDIMSRFGRVDVVVNNAGITRDTLVMRMSEDEWDMVLRVNLKSVFNCTHAVLRPMVKQRGGGNRKHILGCRIDRECGAGQLCCFKGRHTGPYEERGP